MNFKEHATAGTATGVICGTTVLLLTATHDKDWVFMSVFTLAFAGSLFPDLDTKSTPTLWFARFASICFIYGIFGHYDSNAHLIDLWPLFAPALILCLAQASKHRGWTHSYLLPFVVVGLGMLSPSELLPLCGSFALGLISHYVLDSMSPLKLKNWPLW